MGETLPVFRSSFNKSLRINQIPTGSAERRAGVLLREIMQRTRIIEFKKAKVAVALKLAVILHRMWRDGTEGTAPTAKRTVNPASTSRRA